MLRLLQFKKKVTGFELMGFNEVFLEPDLVHQGKIADMGAFKTSLHELFEESQPYPVKAGNLYVNIPDNLVYSFVKDFPHHAVHRSICPLMMDSARKHLPVPFEDLHPEFASVTTDHKVSYALYASPKKWRERLSKACKEFGVKSIEFIPESVASVTLAEYEQGEDFALFSGYRGGISLSLFHNGLLYDSYYFGDFENELPADCSADCMSEFERAQADFEETFGRDFDRLIFIGFESAHEKKIGKLFEKRGYDLNFIGSEHSDLNALIPYEKGRTVLFGLFNYLMKR